MSLWLATQRPKGAISDAATSQIDTFIVHRLSVAEDIKAVCGLLQNSQPEAIRAPGGRTVDLHELVRSLETGQAVFSSASSTASRLVVGVIRPRNVAHGGGNDDGAVEIWDYSTGRIDAVARFSSAVRALSVSPDGATLVVACENGGVYSLPEAHR